MARDTFPFASLLSSRAAYVRFVVFFVLFLALAGWTLAHWPQPPQMPAESTYTWRRTAAGWERVDRWPTHRVERYQGAPLLWGSFQLGVSLVALLAGHDAEQRRARRRGSSASAPLVRSYKSAPRATVQPGDLQVVS